MSFLLDGVDVVPKLDPRVLLEVRLWFLVVSMSES